MERLVENEESPVRPARACALGVGIALSPYLGIQTLFIFVLSWIFRLQTRIVFTVAYIINNPWTMFPIALFDYLVGSRIAALLKLDLTRYNPAWVQWLTAWINNKIGHHICRYVNVADFSFWAYMLGGHLVALIGGIIAYFLAKRFFARVIEKRDINVEKQKIHKH